MENSSVLFVDKLSVSFGDKKQRDQVLHEVSFHLGKNEILGIVGESGSGKSVTSLAILGLLDKKAKIDHGKVLFEQADLLSNREKDWQKVRGNKISMIFQEPMSSLNPSMRCGKQVLEVLLQHTKMNKSAAKKETLALFEKVKLPAPEAIFNAYPHEISGGQKQRVMIAMAIACKPKILIADEPTTALDVTVQKEILSLLKTLQEETQMSIIFISHDLSLVSEIAHRVLVMYQGKVVEENTTEAVFLHPRATYTKALLASKPPEIGRPEKLLTVSDFLETAETRQIPQESLADRQARHRRLYAQDPLLEVIDLQKEFVSRIGFFGEKKTTTAVDQVSFKLYEGETLGLVGESGCGKSTLGNLILQLLPATHGKVFYRGQEITQLKGTALRQLRKEVQLIFQDPFSSLNPRIPVGKSLMEPMEVHGLHGNSKKRKEKALALLKDVGLEEAHFYRYPHEFSGGQRQRIGIARTIAVEPKLIVCDESVSALDISVQAQVLNLLNLLKKNYGFTYLFISHDLSVVRYMADQLLVMSRGEIVERGEADAVYTHPQKQYTKQLINAIPKGL